VITTVKPLTPGNHSTREEMESQYKSSQEKHDRERLLAVLMVYEKNTLQYDGEISESVSRFQRIARI